MFSGFGKKLVAIGVVTLGLAAGFGEVSTSVALSQQSSEQNQGSVAAGTSGPAVVDAGSYPSLQAAVNALPESGGLVRVPPGIFRLEKPLVISRSNVRLEGSGPATVLVNHCREGEPSLIICPPEAEKSPKARLWRVEITGLRIQGDPTAIDDKSGQPTSGHGIWAQNVNEIFIHGVTVDHHGGHGIYLLNCYENPRIIGCNITYNRGSGIHIEGGHDIVVTGNQLEENGTALQCLDGFNLCMTGNNIDDHLGQGVVVENTYGSVISGNMIEECQGAAIVLNRDCYGITVSANVIAHNFGGGVHLLDAWGCAVSANTFVLNRGDSVYIGPESGRVTVSSNSFCDSFIGSGTRRPETDNLAGGIRLEGTTDITITGNQFSGLDGPAVIADAQCKGILVSGNIARELNRRAKEPRPAFDLPSGSGIWRANNLLDGTQEH
jgi:parallel beta-helix repeat protein